MKIAWVHSHFLYSVGATRYIFEVCKRLGKKHELTVFVEKSSPYWKEKFLQEAIPLREIIPFSSTSPIYWLFFPFFALWDLAILKKETGNFDLVITSIFPMNWLSLYLGKSTIFLCFEPFSFFYNTELIKRLPPLKRASTKVLAKLYSRYDFSGTRNSDKLLTLNEARASLIKEIYGRRPEGITGIAVNTHFFKSTENERLGKRHQGQKIILHSTDFTIPKGTHFLIKALPEIVKKISEVRLLVMSTVSDLGERRWLENLSEKLRVRKNVEFLGFVGEKLLPAYYSLADVVAFVGDPANTVSKSSLIILEALACQTPVVCSVGHLEGMIDQKTGYFVNPKNTKDLASKIIKILGDKRAKNKMGTFGRDLVLREYNWEKVAKTFEEQINKIEIQVYSKKND